MAKIVHIQVKDGEDADPPFNFDPPNGSVDLPSKQAHFVSPWEAALWVAFGSIEHLGDLLPRSFDHGLERRSDDTDETLAARRDLHTRFDAAEGDVRDALIAGDLVADGVKSVGQAGRYKAGSERSAIAGSVFQNSELAFDPSGHLIWRRPLMDRLFPDDLRGTEADAGLPLWMQVWISAGQVTKLWPAAAVVRDQSARLDLLSDVQKDAYNWMYDDIAHRLTLGSSLPKKPDTVRDCVAAFKTNRRHLLDRDAKKAHEALPKHMRRVRGDSA